MSACFPRGRHSLCYGVLNLLTISTLQLIGCANTPALAQQAQPFDCVARTANATPPPYPAAPPPVTTAKNAARKKGAPAVTMRPLCPSGQVPVLRQNAQTNSTAGPNRVLKGNPLLQGQSDQTRLQSPQALPQTAAAPRQFHEVYGKQVKKVRPRSEKGATPGTQPECRGTFQDGACYYYGSAGLQGAADGGGMTFSIDRPRYVNTGGEGHTLNEISIQGGAGGGNVPANGNIVELGWTVSTEQNGDADPHIFVFHWVNWNGTCYNGCGWEQVSDTYYPGQNIAALLGHEVYVGYVYYGGNWWAWFNGQWLGYFPESLWPNGFSKTTLIQWFGEVATNNGVPPQTQMGAGVLPPPRTAAHMFTLCDVDAKAWVCSIGDKQQLSPPAIASYYNVKRTGFGDTRYGGPGK